jgi:hypothetical protein
MEEEGEMRDDIPDRVQTWEDHGFFVVRARLGAQEVHRLVQACDHVLARVRARSSSAGHTTTHIDELLSPEHFTDRPELLTALTELASSRLVLSLIHDLGQGGGGAIPMLRGVHYFHEPSVRDHEGHWHRDGEGASAHPDRNEPRVTRLRVRIALSYDDHLEYAPGSHKRVETDEALTLRTGALRHAPLAQRTCRIVLEQGDLCVFNVWGIHRGRYRRARVRKTLDFLYSFGYGEPQHAGTAIQALLARFATAG